MWPQENFSFFASLETSFIFFSFAALSQNKDKNKLDVFPFFFFLQPLTRMSSEEDKKLASNGVELADLKHEGTFLFFSVS